jgi:hypothetical protein
VMVHRRQKVKSNGRMLSGLPPFIWVLFVLWTSIACRPASPLPQATDVAVAPSAMPQSVIEETKITAAPQEKEGTMTPTSKAADAELPPGSGPLVQLAKEDLVDKLGLAPEAIQLVSVEAVDWPDASLGCPQEGMMYAQVITPGFLIVLEVEGQTYEYHTDSTDYVVLCENPE